MKKILTTLLGLFGAPEVIRRPGNNAPAGYAPEIGTSIGKANGVSCDAHRSAITTREFSNMV